MRLLRVKDVCLRVMWRHTFRRSARSDNKATFDAAGDRKEEATRGGGQSAAASLLQQHALSVCLDRK